MLAAAALVATVGGLVRWINPWLVLLALPLAGIGTRLVLTGAGDRDRTRSGDTPAGRVRLVGVGLLAAASVFVSAFVSAWALVPAVAGTVLVLVLVAAPAVSAAPGKDGERR